MNRGRTTNGKGTVVLAVIFALIVAAGMGFPSPRVGAQTEAITDSSPNGTELSASISSTSLPTGQNLSVTVSIFNTLPSVNDVPASNDWPFEGVNLALWGGCIIRYPVQVAVLSGDYTLQELPSVANATLQYVCMGSINVDHVIFQPNSNVANLTAIGPAPSLNQTHGPYSQTLTFSTSGYWNLSSLSMEQAIDIPIIGPWGNPVPATAFVPGVYTLAVEDEWGQELALHFAVTSSGRTGPATTTSTVAQGTVPQNLTTAVLTSTSAVPNTSVFSSVPSWVYAVMALALLAGALIVGVSRRKPTERRSPRPFARFVDSLSASIRARTFDQQNRICTPYWSNLAGHRIRKNFHPFC